MKTKKTKGFTLIEALLATVVGALIVVVALASFRSVSQSRSKIQYYSDINANARFALNMIRDDLANIYRNRDHSKMMLSGIRNLTGDSSSDKIILYTVSDKKNAHQPTAKRYLRSRIPRQFRPAGPALVSGKTLRNYQQSNPIKQWRRFDSNR